MAIPTPKSQLDVNTRGRSDNTFYDHITSTVLSATASPTVGGSGSEQFLTFNGTTQYVQASMPTGLSSTFADGDYTIAAKIKTTGAISANTWVFGFNNAADSRRVNIGLSSASGAPLHGFDTVSGTDCFITGSSDADDTNWHVIVNRRVGTTFSCWLDGTKIGESTVAVGTMGTLDEYCIARRGGSTDNWHFPGSVMWAAVWDNDLSDSEIGELDDVANPFLTTPGVTVDDSTATPGQSVVATAAYAFSAAIQSITFPNGQVVNANGGATTTTATFVMPALSAFVLGGTHETTPWSTDLSMTVTAGSQSTTVTMQIVAPSATGEYSGLAGATPYPADSRLPAGTVQNDRYFAKYTAGEGTFNEYGVASQSVLPATLEVRRFQSGSWSQIDTYNFAITDAVPDAYTIPDVSDAEIATQYISSAVTPAGFNAAAAITITGGEYSINGASYTSGAGTFNPGDSFRVRVTSSSAYNTAVTATVTIGGVSSSYVVTTKAIILDVDPFTIPEVTGVVINTGVESTTITPTGFNSTVPIAIVNGTYSINGGGYTSATGTVDPGDTIKVKVTSANDYDLVSTALLTIGDQSALFSVQTQAAQRIPSAFNFPEKNLVAIGTAAVTSDPIAITGINTTVSVFVSGSASAEYSKNDGPWTALSGSAENGDIFKVRVSSSDAYDTLTTASLTVGGTTGTFNVRTVTEEQAITGGLKVKLETVESGFMTTTLLNENFVKTQNTLNDKVLFRENPDGTPNEMKNSLDMNSNRILNLPEAETTKEPVTLGQALELLGGDNIAISGYATKALTWVKANDNGNWTPILNYGDVEVRFIQAGITIASRVVRGILDTNNGNINVTTLSTLGQQTALTVVDNNTPAPTVTVTHADSGSTVPVIMFSVKGGTKGNDGEDGTDGTDGADGVAAVQYYIRPTNGTAIKNGVGSLTIEARALGAASDTLLASGDVKLYVGNTLVTVANGYATGSDGYTGVFDSTDINDSVLVVLKDTVQGITYDSITLVDIEDGVASNATVGSIAPSNGLGWSRAVNAGAWAPAQSYTDLVCTFYQGGSAIATETRRVTLNTSTGALTEALQGSNDANIDVTVSGSTTAALNIVFTHTPSGIKVAETVHSVLSGTDGADGADGADGVDGENATMYYIKATDGTAIKNGVGTLTIEAHQVDGTSDSLLSSGTRKLYVGTTEVTVANGYATGSNGYTGVFDSGDISDSVVVSLKNGPSGTVYDTITLVDIIDGIGSNATTGSIATTNGLAWVRAANAGAWSPGTTTTDLVATFYQGGVAVASETQRVSLNTTAGTLTSAQVGTNHADVSVDVSGSGTSAITVTFTHVPSGAKVAEQVMAVQGGSQGSQGTPGTPGVNGVLYYIKPTAGTAIKNGVGNLTVEAHKVDGTADVLLSSGTIKLYVNTTEVTTGNGYASGSNGYTGVFSPTNINEKVVVSLKDGPNGTVLDTITLIDVEDGTGSNATYGSITPSASLAWLKPTGGAWTPANTYVDLACIFYQGGVSVGGETRRVTLNTSDGTLTSALSGSDDANITVTTTGSGTQVLTVTFTHVPSGAKVSETVLSVKGTGSATQRVLTNSNLAGTSSTSFTTLGNPVSVRVQGSFVGNGGPVSPLTLTVQRSGTTIGTATLPLVVSSLPFGGGSIWTVSPTPVFDTTYNASQGAGTYTYTTSVSGLSLGTYELYGPLSIEIIEISNG